MTACLRSPSRSSISGFKATAAFFALTIAILHLLCACALHLPPQGSIQERSLDPPHKVVIYLTKHGKVELEKLTDYEGKRIQFAVTYFNKGSTASSFGLKNITASDSAGKNIRIYTDQDFLEEATDKVASVFRQSYGGFSYDNMVGNIPLNTQQQAIYNNAIESKAGAATEEMIGLRGMIPVNRNVPPNTSTSGLLILNKTPLTIFKINVAGEEYSALFHNE